MTSPWFVHWVRIVAVPGRCATGKKPAASGAGRCVPTASCHFPALDPAAMSGSWRGRVLDRATCNRGGSSMSMLRTAALAGGVCAAFALGATAQEFNDKPLEENWWPTEWGPDDKVGAPNRTTPEIVLEAVKLVKHGKTATLGKLYAHDIPFFGVRAFRLNIPGTPTGGPFGSNMMVFHDELVTTEIGQVGTQFDGPGHIGIRTSQGDLFYNGRNREEAYRRGAGNMVMGMGDLGVEHVAEKGFVCRGVLLDATKHRGMNPLPIPTSTDSPGIVTADDVKAMVEAAGIEEIGEGDCVFLYTGHGDLWKNSE